MEENELKIGQGKKKRKKRRIKLIIALATLLLIGTGFASGLFGGKKITYELVKAARKDLKESVEITGNVEADATIALSFQTSGKLEKMNFDVGGQVNKNDIIASLANREQELTLLRAKANLTAIEAELAARLAGSTREQIRIAEVGVEQAEVNYTKLLRDKQNTAEELVLIREKYLEDEKRTELQVKDAKDKLDFTIKNQSNTGSTDTQTIINAQKDLYAQLLSTSALLQSSMTTVRAIIINDGNSVYGSLPDQINNTSKEISTTAYNEVKIKFDPLYAEIRSSTTYTTAQLKTWANTLQEFITRILEAQKALIDGISYIPPSDSLPASTITQVRNLLLADSSTISGSLSALNTVLQKLINAELGITSSTDTQNSAVTSAQNFYDQQLQSLAQLKIDHKVDLNARQTQIEGLQSQLEIQKATIDSAKANLAQVKAGPRSVDVASLKAQIAAAQIDVELNQENYEKTLLRAPVSGVLSRRNAEIGEEIAGAFAGTSTSQIPVFEMISNDKYKINADIAEVDISKLQVGDKASITLDAIGSDTKFEGTIVKIDPVSTEIQDVVFYKAEIVIESRDERIKPGMSSNVEIILTEAKNVITVPERSVQKDGKARYVRMIKAGEIIKIPVETGIRSLQGDIEIKSGLSEGQEIILRTNGN